MMKRILLCAAVGLLAAPMLANAYVGVSVNVGQPGFYGQINLGDAPPPQVIYTQPVWIQRGPVDVAPIYLRVPYAHYHHWSRYCAYYHACGRPVYFVRDSWYNGVYAPYYRQHYGYGGGYGGGYGRDWHGGDRGGWGGDHRGGGPDGWDHRGGHGGDDHGGGRGDGRGGDDRGGRDR